MLGSRTMRALAASVGGGGARMFTRGVFSAHSARAGRSGMFKAVGLVGGAALFVGALAANPAQTLGAAEQEEDGLSTRMLKTVGLHSWFVWAVEPAEKAGCPPGTLLPDPPELPPGMIQRTLVLSLEDTLIFTQWDRKRGHRTQKRPGLDAFLAHMSQVAPLNSKASLRAPHQHLRKRGNETAFGGIVGRWLDFSLSITRSRSPPPISHRHCDLHLTTRASRGQREGEGSRLWCTR